MNVGVADVLVAKVFSVERVTFLQSGTISGITKWNNATTTVVGDGTCVRNVNYVQDQTYAVRAPAILAAAALLPPPIVVWIALKVQKPNPERKRRRKSTLFTYVGT